MGSTDFSEVAGELTNVAKSLSQRGWLLGTSGNLSAVIGTEPLRLAITPSGADKGALQPTQILLIDDQCQRVETGSDTQSARPSDESLLHVAIVKLREAGAVIHTHSVWSTILSDAHAQQQGIAIEGYEMLKGLRGVSTHLHRELIPIIGNSQDMAALALEVGNMLTTDPSAHAFILRRHGLYTWGRDLKEAQRHIEILEFLLEVLGRSSQANIN